MTMVVDFADGFTSGSRPDLIGLGNESYELLNNQAVDVAIDGLNFDGYTTVFASLEIDRFNGTESFRQSMPMVFQYNSNDDTWSFDVGAYKGDNMLKSEIVDPKDIVLTIDAAGQLYYKSGNMDSFGYEGNLKFNLDRINT